jgi:hypothetical protein
MASRPQGMCFHAAVDGRRHHVDRDESHAANPHSRERDVDSLVPGTLLQKRERVRTSWSTLDASENPPQHSNSSGPEREHIGAQPWIARGQSEDVASPHGSGDQANHSRSLETRKSVCAHIHSACVSDRLSIEQH